MFETISYTVNSKSSHDTYAKWGRSGAVCVSPPAPLPCAKPPSVLPSLLRVMAFTFCSVNYNKAFCAFTTGWLKNWQPSTSIDRMQHPGVVGPEVKRSRSYVCNLSWSTGNSTRRAERREWGEWAGQPVVTFTDGLLCLHFITRCNYIICNGQFIFILKTFFLEPSDNLI